MPSRVIRGEINSSESLSRVSSDAELTFTRLLTCVDDYGRCDARLPALKAGLFPFRDEFTPERIADFVAELCAEGCVARYEVDGRPYLFLTGWEKHRGNSRRAKTSRFPEPPEIPDKAETSPDPPDIREMRGDPPVGMESRVESRGYGVESDDATAPSHTENLPTQADAERLLNLLSRHSGELDEKRAWMIEELPVMEADVAAGKGTYAQIVTRYYRQYLKGPRKHQDAAKRASEIEKAQRWEAEHGKPYAEERNAASS